VFLDRAGDTNLPTVCKGSERPTHSIWDIDKWVDTVFQNDRTERSRRHAGQATVTGHRTRKQDDVVGTIDILMGAFRDRDDHVR
jgi:hypothetical protein